MAITTSFDSKKHFVTSKDLVSLFFLVVSVAFEFCIPRFSFHIPFWDLGPPTGHAST